MPRDGAGLDLGTDLAHALDAAMFAEDRLGFTPDPWQADLLRSTAMQIIVNVARQTGKSTTTAIKGLHTAIYDPGLVLLVSPSLRQSRELFGKVIGFLKDLQPAEILEEDNKSSCTLANGSRIVSLPGDARTIRGYSAPKLIIVDEAARGTADVRRAASDAGGDTGRLSADPPLYAERPAIGTIFFRDVVPRRGLATVRGARRGMPAHLE